MKALERCRQTTGTPLFVGIISERYGWIPNVQDVPPEFQKR